MRYFRDLTYLSQFSIIMTLRKVLKFEVHRKNVASLNDWRVIKRLGVLSLNGRSSHMNFSFSIPIVTWNVTLPSLLSLRR